MLLKSSEMVLVAVNGKSVINCDVGDIDVDAVDVKATAESEFVKQRK
jgi:hypothetical protein